MKEATGELSSTVIVVVSVGILVAFFYYTVWPIIDHNFKTQTACDKAVCSSKPDSKGYVNCVYTDKKTNKTTEISCKYKG